LAFRLPAIARLTQTQAGRAGTKAKKLNRLRRINKINAVKLLFDIKNETTKRQYN
jgi:hypothetical protein